MLFPVAGCVRSMMSTCAIFSALVRLMGVRCAMALSFQAQRAPPPWAGRDGGHRLDCAKNAAALPFGERGARVHASRPATMMRARVMAQGP